MRRPRRPDAGSGSEIAMMAVITKAMGAFLVLVVLLMPYYVVNTNVEALTQNVQEKMDKVKSQSSTTIENIKQALAKAGKGRLTDKEIDELEAQIKQLETDLAAAYAEVDRLNATVKQQAAQIVRLQKEIDRQKQEIEELKRHQGDPPLVISQISWKGCVGTRFVPLVRVVDSSGKASGRLSRVPTAAFDTAKKPWRLDDDSGLSRSSVEIGAGLTTIDVWFLRLNGVMTDHTSCRLDAEILVRNTAYQLGSFEVQDKTVGFLGQVKAGKNAIEPGQPGDHEVEKDLDDLITSECEGLTCFYKEKPGDQKEVGNAFADYLIKSKVPETIARELGGAVGADRMQPSAAFRWSQLVIDLPSAQMGQPVFDIPRDFNDLLMQKGAPPTVREFAKQHVPTDDATLNSIVKRMRNWPDAIDPTLVPAADELRRSGLPTELAGLFAYAIDGHHLTRDDAEMWADILKQANVDGPRKYETNQLALLQSPKLSAAKNGLAVPLAEVFSHAIAEGKASRDDVLALLGVPNPSGPSNSRLNAATPPGRAAPAPSPDAQSNATNINASLARLVTSGAMSNAAAAIWTKAITEGTMAKEVKAMTAKAALRDQMKLPDALVDLLAKQYSEGTITIEQIKALQSEMPK